MNTLTTSLLIISCLLLAIFFSSGVIYSFNAYASVLVRMGVFDNINDSVLQLIPVVIFNLASFSVVISGLLIDAMGLKANAVMGCLVFSTGLVCLVFNYVFVGMCALAYGGMMTVLTLYPLANYFENPSHQVLFRSAINACYNLATLVFLLVSYVTQYVPTETIFLYYAIAGYVVVLIVAYWCPWDTPHPLSSTPTFTSSHTIPSTNVISRNLMWTEEKEELEEEQDENEESYCYRDEYLPPITSNIREVVDVLPDKRVKYVPLLSPTTYFLGTYFGIMLLVTNIYYTTQVDPSQTQTFDMILAFGPVFIIGFLPYHFNTKTIGFWNCVHLSIYGIIFAFIGQLIAIPGFDVASFVLFIYGRTVFINLVYDTVYKQYAPSSYGRAIGFITGMTIIIGLLQLILVSVPISSQTLNYVVSMVLIAMSATILCFQQADMVVTM